jgi:hypothetical protein
MESDIDGTTHDMCATQTPSTHRSCCAFLREGTAPSTVLDF